MNRALAGRPRLTGLAIFEAVRPPFLSLKKMQPYACVLTVYIRVKVRLDLQADKSSAIVKGPFFPRVMNPSIESVEQICDARVDILKPRNFDLQKESLMHLILKNITRTNLIYLRPEVARD
jgi:hypothetical protein